MLTSLRAARDRLRASQWKIGRAVRLEIYAFWRKRPIQKNLVLYESFGGNGVLDNPEAIFRGLLADPGFAHFEHVWVLSSEEQNPQIASEFADTASVRFVAPATRSYYRALATAKYLINNATFPAEFSKREGQIYLNTWHGTPLKRMGFDIGDYATRVGNVIRNFLSADFLLGMNHFMTERLYEQGHRLRGIYRGQILEEGYPRIDRQFVGDDERDAIRNRLEQDGIALDGRKVILYAPTWKGESFAQPTDDARELLDRVTELEALIDPSRFVVLLKTHQAVHAYASGRPEFARRLVSNELPTNAILAVTDILVTDYSSTFFDFLATGQPIAFLTPDIDDYSGYRGLYILPEDLPGPVVRTIPELASAITSIIASGLPAEVSERYAAAQERFVPNEDGQATRRVIESVFRGAPATNPVASIADNGKTSILLAAGGLRPNAVTTAAINVLSAIDHDRYDVTVIFPYSRQRAVREQLALIDPAVRQMSRVGTINGSAVSQLARRVAWWSGTAGRPSRRQRELWRDEWTRCFGSSRFDCIVDFSGYGRLWSSMMLAAPNGERSIWLHDDMALDAVVTPTSSKKDRRRARELRTVFSVYQHYDHLVSTSEPLMRTNRAHLAAFASPDAFDWAPSVIDAQRIILASKANDRALANLTGDAKTFISVGRLSGQREQNLIIRAFAQIRPEAPGARLIILGSGPMLDELKSIALECGVTDAVVFIGHRVNPYPIVAAAGCFVVASDADRQQTVSAEAEILGLAIAAPDAGATDRRARLASAMLEFVNGELSAKPLDVETRNQHAVDAFTRAIGAGTRPPAEH